MTIDLAQVDGRCGPTSWTPHPQVPISRRDGGTDRWREQHGHSRGLAIVPGGDQTFGIFEGLLVGCAAGSRFLLGSRPALIFHLSAVEAHAMIVAEALQESMSASPPIAAAPSTRCGVQ